MIRMPDGIHGQRFFRSTGNRSGPTSSDDHRFFGAQGRAARYLLCTTLRRSLCSRNPGRSSSMSGIPRASPAPDTAGKGTD